MKEKNISSAKERPSDEILTRAEVAAIQSYGLKFLNEQWTSQSDPETSGPGFLFAGRDFENNFYDLVGEPDKRGYYTPKYREAVKVFLDALMDFCHEKRDDENIKNFVGRIRTILFSTAPCIASGLEFTDKFNFTAKTTRTPEVRTAIGSNMIGEFVYSLSWDYDPQTSAKKIVSAYQHSSLGEKFDKINLLEMIGAQACAEGSHAEVAVDATTEATRQIIEQEKNSNALLAYYGQIAMERLAREAELPSVGIIKYMDDPANARLQDGVNNLNESSIEKLNSQFTVKGGLGYGEKLYRIAKNAIAVLDHANKPIRYAYCDFPEKESENKISLNKLNELIGFLEGRKNGQMSKQEIYDLITFVSKHVLFPQKKNWPGNAKLAAAWKEASLAPDSFDWSEYFSTEQKLSESEGAVQEQSQRLHKRAENEALSATRKFINRVARNLHIIKDVVAEYPILQKLQEEFIEYKDGDVERALTRAEKLSKWGIIALGRDGQSIPPAVVEFAARCGDLGEEHVRIWREAHAKYENLVATQHEQNRSLELAFEKQLGTLTAEESFAAKLSEYLKAIQADSLADATVIQAKPIDELKNESFLKLILKTNPDEQILLMQHLHRPGLRTFIETKLGISLADIPLDHQFNLLRFLAESPTSTIDATKNLLDSSIDEPDKQNRIKAFLAMQSGGHEIGLRILEIGQRLSPKQAKEFFAKLSEITDLAEKENSAIQELLFSDLQENEAQDLRQNMLMRSAQEISSFAESLSNHKISATDAGKLLANLRDKKAEILLFGSLLKNSKEASKPIKIEKVKNLGIEKAVVNSENALTAKDTESLRRLFTRTYESIFANNPEALARVSEDFEKELANLEGQTVYSLKYCGEIIAFCRFKPIDDKNIYGGSLLVNDTIRGLSVGEYFMQATLSDVSETHNIHIKSRKDNKANGNYQRQGFEITGEHAEKDGVEYFDMVMPSKLEQLKKAA